MLALASGRNLYVELDSGRAAFPAREREVAGIDRRLFEAHSKIRLPRHRSTPGYL